MQWPILQFFLQESSNCDAIPASSFIEARVAPQLLLSWRKLLIIMLLPWILKQSAVKWLILLEKAPNF